MKQRQRGATFLGLVTIILILGAGLYGAIRLVPVYLEFTKVSRALQQVRDEYAATDTNPQMIRKALERRWDVEDIQSIGWKDIQITRTSEGFDMRAAYDAERPFIANVYLLARFDRVVSIPQ